MKQRVLQRHSLGVRQRDALLQRLAGYLLQQLHLAVLVGQVEIAAQYLAQYKHPVEMVGARDGAARHQLVAFPRDAGRSRLLVLLGFGLEGSRLGIEVHLGVGTHVDRPLQPRLQILNAEPELVLVGPARAPVQILMKLLHFLLLCRQLCSVKHLTPTNYLHTLARCT